MLSIIRMSVFSGFALVVKSMGVVLKSPVYSIFLFSVCIKV